LQVLIAFFILITFVIPYAFWIRINESEKDVGGVDVDNRKIFTDLINENMLGKQIPGILSQSTEFSLMKVKSKEELEILKRIKAIEEVKEAIPKQKPNTPEI
jgi:hypothetical protein